MVECESARLPFCSMYVAPVLIDTWWNVNTEKKLSSLESLEVLIDTWWNVNLDTVIRS